MARGFEWALKQQEAAELLRGADHQAIIAKGYNKTMVSRVVNAIKTELKHLET